MKKVFVSGCYDLLHSGHVEFFRQAAQYGDLYVGIGSDETILHYKGHRTLYDENERLFMVKAIRYVKDAFINKGSGIMDFIPTVDMLKPDILVVNEDGDKEEKRRFCKERGIEYVVLERTPHVVPHAAPHPALDAAQSLIPASEPESQKIAGQARNEGGQARNEGGQARNEGGQARNEGGQARNEGGQARNEGGQARNEGGQARNEGGQVRNEGTALPARSSTDLKNQLCRIPTRLDLAGTWIDQPYVSQYAPGWAITISLEPTFEIRERCGLSTSTRNMIKKIWPVKLPNMDPEFLAKLMFCFENDPERSDGIISGAQDSIGICIPGLCRHYYDKRYWPLKIETCKDEDILQWLENHLVMIPMEPRKPGCSVVEGKDITETKVKALAKAADDCWNAILNKDLKAFAEAYKASFEAQVAMFPGMVNPVEIPGQARNEEAIPHAAPHAALDAGSAASHTIQDYIDKWSKVPGVLAWKMPGAGGGGYLACVVEDAEKFAKEHSEAIIIKIRR